MTRKLQMYLDEARCTSCGGACCKNMPGLTTPEDWGAPDHDVMIRRLEVAFATGDWAIDWWEGDPRKRARRPLSEVLYVRPSTVEGKAEGRLMDPSWGGQCALLTPTGCPLPREGRPTMCRTLEPLPEGLGRCEQHFLKKDVAATWIKYQTLLRALAQHARLEGERQGEARRRGGPASSARKSRAGA